MTQKLIQKQTERQGEAQQLSTLQVALSNLLELPVAELSERVRNEMVDNAALEEADGDHDDEPRDVEDGDSDDAEFEADETDEHRNEEDEERPADDADDWSDAPSEIGDSLGDYATIDDVPSYLQDRADQAREQHEVPVVGASSFYDDLLNQMGEHNLNEHEREVVAYLIGSLDDDGFLRKDLATIADEMAIYHNVETDEAEVRRLLAELQTFEPRGIGAQSLQECLRLQLESPDFQSPYKSLALAVVNSEFKAFASKHWDEVAAHLGMDADTAAHVRHILTHLNPRPGSALGSNVATAAPTVVPDFYVYIGADNLPVVEIEGGDVPELRVSPAFRDTISQYSRSRHKLSREQHDAYVYARQKVEAAQTFIGLLHRRRQTLLAVMQAIVDLQEDFFTADDDEERLRPMTLREVAVRAGVDISTVSRAASSKYVQTDYGIYPLKYFFSLQFTAETGDEISSRQVKMALRDIIAAEDKHAPYPDEMLAALLKQRGFPVARRTVAKYREQLGILSTRLRRE